MPVLADFERVSDWKRKWRKLPRGRGVGVAGSCYISGTNYPDPKELPQAGIQIGIERSGRITVLTARRRSGRAATAWSRRARRRNLACRSTSGPSRR